jgi:hypothetical protein
MWKNFKDSLVGKGLKSYTLWKNCGKTRGFFHRLLDELKSFHKNLRFSTVFPQSFPQKTRGFPQAFSCLIIIYYFI